MWLRTKFPNLNYLLSQMREYCQGLIKSIIHSRELEMNITEILVKWQ